jgi:quercetin dioxygenase-like cupin family protein
VTAIPALVIPLREIKADLAGAAALRGDRKLLVTSLRPEKERPADSVDWRAPGPSDRCEVLVTHDTELAVFNETAKQDRHFHQEATEIYAVIEGVMVIEVAGKVHRLEAGDMIVVNRGACHEVKPAGSKFFCLVVSANCRGQEDRHSCELLASREGG